MVEYLEPRRMLSAPAEDPTLSPIDLGVVSLNETSGEWEAARFNGETFVAETLTTWQAVPEETVVVHGDLWGTGQKQLIHFVSETGLFEAEWKSGSGIARATVAGWAAGMELEFLTAQDLNHDGFDDLIAMDRRTGNWAIATFLPDGSTYSRFVGTWRTNVDWQHVAFADLNADGLDDIVGYNPTNQSWNVLIGGPYNFRAVTLGDPTPSGSPLDVRMASFDGTPGTDILERDSVTGKWTAISLVQNQLRAQVVGQWRTNQNWVDIQSVDFWGIGREALIGRDAQTNEWQLTWSVGSGFSTSSMTFWGPGAYADALVADVNQDGREDVIARQVTSGEWFALSSSSNSIQTDSLGVWEPQARYDLVEHADFNGDHQTDWIGLESVTGTWRAMLSTGASSYVTSELTAPSFGYVAQDAGVADYDLDGSLDIITRDQGTGNRLLVSIAGGALTATRFDEWTAYGESWTDPLTLDFNGDGDNDLLARDAATGDWWLSTFTATTPTTQKVARWNPAVSWENQFTLDFDGNGTTDVLARDATTGNWHLLRSDNGIVNSSVIANWSPTGTWVDFQVADILGNGRPMIVARNEQTGVWQGLWSSGSGFTTAGLRGLAPNRTYLDTRVVRFFADQRQTLVTRDEQTGVWYALWFGSSRFNLTSLGTWDPGGTWECVAAADLEGTNREALYGHDAKSGQTWRLSFDGSGALNVIVAVSAPNLYLKFAEVGRFVEGSKQSIVTQETATGRWYRLVFNGVTYTYINLGIWSETPDWTTTKVGDFNRDGRDDLFGYSPSTSTWTVRAYDGRNWVQHTVGALGPSANVTDVAGASDATLRAVILADLPPLAAAYAARDVHTMATLLRNWVANAADSALYSDPLMEGARSPAEAFYTYYSRDRAGSSCGGISEFFIQVLRLFEIDSLTIGLGDYAADLIHTTVVVPIATQSGWRFELYDATFNCSFTNTLTNSTATYFDMIDAARVGITNHLTLDDASVENRRFVSTVPVNNPAIILERYDDGVYVYRWPDYGIDDYLAGNHDALVNHGYSPGLQGFFQLLPQVHVVNANNGSGNAATSESQRSAFMQELSARGITVADRPAN